ncbi:MAG TPA: MFS transporter [Verrucomicrobiae bacterium]|nr:MFS transporter [Verrucomicrobiae bacterium]
MSEPTSVSEGNGPTVVTVPADALAQPRRVVTGGISWRKTFSALRHRNYQLFFSGQLVSLIGTWMQMVAEGWLVYQLSNSAFLLGFVRFLNTLPVTALTLVGGVVADRSDKRRILVATQFSAMSLAFILAALVYFHVVRVWHVAALGLMLGIVNAFDIPTRQSFVVDMVGKEDLMNAIALNSSVFNGARIFGPALAGILIGVVGLAGCFFLNGVSFIAVIVGYLAMRLPAVAPKTNHPSVWQATAEAFRHVAGNRVTRTIIILVAIVSLFGWPYTVLMPVFARDVLHVGAKGYGYLMALNGVGAFTGAMTLASLGHYPNRRRLVFGGLTGFSVMLFVFALSRTAWLSGLALVCSGWFMLLFFATANTSVQMRTPDELRGRVMGIYSLAFIGLSPVGSLLAGAIAHATSAPFAVAFGAAVCAVSAVVVHQLVPPQSPPAAAGSAAPEPAR